MLEQVANLRVDLEGILVLKEVKLEELTARVSECNTNGYDSLTARRRSS